MPISLTFDDGWKSQYENALPILDKYQLKATFYIITCFLPVDDKYYMNKSQILRLYHEGHEIGAHTVTHPNLQLTFPWNQRQIPQSKTDLENIGIKVKSFSYPYGKHHFLARRMARNSGYENARAVGGRCNKTHIAQYAVKARSVKATTTIDQVRSWIDKARDRLLVLVFHDISEQPGPWGCTPHTLEEICRLLTAPGIVSLPLTDALKAAKKNTPIPA